MTDGRDRNPDRVVEQAEPDGAGDERDGEDQLDPEQHRVDTAHDEVIPFDKESRLDDADPEETGG